LGGDGDGDRAVVEAALVIEIWGIDFIGVSEAGVRFSRSGGGVEDELAGWVAAVGVVGVLVGIVGGDFRDGGAAAVEEAQVVASRGELKVGVEIGGSGDGGVWAVGEDDEVSSGCDARSVGEGPFGNEVGSVGESPVVQADGRAGGIVEFDPVGWAVCESGGFDEVGSRFDEAGAVLEGRAEVDEDGIAAGGVIDLEFQIEAHVTADGVVVNLDCDDVFTFDEQGGGDSEGEGLGRGGKGAVHVGKLVVKEVGFGSAHVGAGDFDAVDPGDEAVVVVDVQAERTG